MHLNFSSEQDQLRSAVRRWVERAYSFERRRRAVENGGFDPAAYSQLAELGLCGVAIAEGHGGLGAGPVEAMIAAEELGRGMVLEPLGSCTIASVLLSRHANQALQDAWLPRMAAGDVLLVLAHQEAGSRYCLERCQTRAQSGGDGWLLRGAKCLVPAGDQSAALLVTADTGSGLSLFLVETDGPGVQAQGYGTQDGSRAADIRFDDAPAVRITADGLGALTEAAALGIASTCAYGVGAMDRVMELTIAYLKDRRQFGVPIASFQALRHRVADMKLQLELARGMSYYATLKLDASSSVRDTAVSRAKAQLGVSMRKVGQEAVQLHGGIGMTDEYVLGSYFKVLTQLEMAWGDTFHHLGIVSERMREEESVIEPPHVGAPQLSC